MQKILASFRTVDFAVLVLTNHLIGREGKLQPGNEAINLILLCLRITNNYLICFDHNPSKMGLPRTKRLFFLQNGFTINAEFKLGNVFNDQYIPKAKECTVKTIPSYT